MKIQVGLSIPFRTLLNFESEALAIEKDAAVERISDALRSVDFKDHVTSFRGPTPKSESHKGGLKNLSDDNIPWFAQPLVTLDMSKTYIDDATSALPPSVSEASARLLWADLTPSLKVEVFDNTLAVASATLELEQSQIPASWSSDDLETFLSLYSSALVSKFNEHVMKRFLEELSEAPDLPKTKKPLLRPAGKFKIFSDLNVHKFPVWDKSIDPCFWCHRIYRIPASDAYGDELLQLFRVGEIRANGYQVNQQSFVYVGSSLVSSEDELSAFLRASAIAQYFYCLLDVLNANQNTIYRNLTANSSRKLLNRLFSEFYRMENFVDYVFNEIMDTEISLQSSRKLYFEALQKSFEMEKLVEILKSRDDLVSDRVERKRHEIDRANRKLIQFVLVVLGASQVLGLLVDVYDYVGPERSSTVWGVTNLAASIDFNLAFHVLSLIVIAGAIYATIRRQ